MRSSSILAFCLAFCAVAFCVMVSYCAPRIPPFHLYGAVVIHDKDPGTPWPIQCGSPCVISSSMGGSVAEFQAEGAAFAKEGRRIVVNGPCVSACTMLVDDDWKNVCLTDQGLLGYHAVYTHDEEGNADQFWDISFDTPGLNDYIKSRGGLPRGSNVALWVDAASAKKFYRSC